jgi:hypothetical protein
MAGLSDLCFDLGIKFVDLVHLRFGCSVSPVVVSSRSKFHLVVSFGRSAARLNVDFVGLILQSCLCGFAKDFNIVHLSG